MTWKDVTSYRRDEEKREPRTCALEFTRVRIVVTRIHGCEGWYMKFYPWIDGQKLKSNILFVARAEALSIAAKLIGEINAEIQALFPKGDQ